MPKDDPKRKKRSVIMDLYERFIASRDAVVTRGGKEVPVMSGGGILEFLSPDPTGIGLASLPLWGRAAAGRVGNVAEHPNFFSNLLKRLEAAGGVVPDVHEIARAYRRADNSSSIDEGFEIAEYAKRVTEGMGATKGMSEATALERSRIRGVGEAAQSQEGRYFLNILDTPYGMPIDLAGGVLDKAAIETLLSSLDDILFP